MAFKLIIIKTTFVAVLVLFSSIVPADESKDVNYFTEKDKQRLDGYFPIWLDNEAGKVYLEIPREKGEFIFLRSLTYRVGSNDLGLDHRYQNQWGQNYFNLI